MQILYQLSYKGSPRIGPRTVLKKLKYSSKAFSLIVKFLRDLVMDTEVLHAVVHGVIKSWTRLSD